MKVGFHIFSCGLSTGQTNIHIRVRRHRPQTLVCPCARLNPGTLCYLFDYSSQSNFLIIQSDPRSMQTSFSVQTVSCVDLEKP